MKLKLVRIYVNRRYLWAFRTVIFLAAAPFLIDLYQAIMTGVVQDGRTTATEEDRKLFYSTMFKKLTCAMLLLWLCTGGLVAKEEGLKKMDDEKKPEV